MSTTHTINAACRWRRAGCWRGERRGGEGRVGAKNVVSAVLMSALNFNCVRRLSEFDNHLGHNRWIISFHRHHHEAIAPSDNVLNLTTKEFYGDLADLDDNLTGVEKM